MLRLPRTNGAFGRTKHWYNMDRPLSKVQRRNTGMKFWNDLVCLWRGCDWQTAVGHLTPPFCARCGRWFVRV